MSKFLRRELQGLTPYIVDRASYKIRLDANESFIKLEDKIIADMKNKLDSALFNRYPDADSEAVCKLYASYAGVSPSHIMAGNGSDELIQIMVTTFVETGEKVAVISPDFSMYSFYTEVGGGIPVDIPSDGEFQLDIDYLIGKVNEIKPKMLILSNPNSPTGGIMERKDLIKLVEEANCLVVVDEAYYEFYRESLTDQITSYDNLIILRTCSKAAGMASIRLGFLMTNEELIKELKSVKPPFNVNSISQSFGEVILSNIDILNSNSEEIVKEREILYKSLSEVKELKAYKTKANFVLVEGEAIKALNQELLAHSIKVRNFGGGRLENCLRITVGSPEENNVMIKVIKDFFVKGGK